MQKYKSKLEKTNGKRLEENKVPYFYEPEEGKISYVIPASIHTYTPDFWVPKRGEGGGWIVIETKGIWDRTDRLKHVWIKKQYPSLDLRFVFSNSRAKTSKGAKQTYADICEGRGRGIFRGLKWQYADKRIPVEWMNE
jgi:hypothetical protein